MSERRRPRFPCRGCFLRCEPTRSALHNGYPCSPRLRLWAWGHRDDPGDEHGYVRERRAGEDG